MRKRTICLVLVVLAMAGLLVVVCRREREPEYGGKRLSHWVRQLGLLGAKGRSEAYPAEEAIRHIGTNSLPYLVKWLRYEPPGWEFKLYGIVDKNFKKNPDDLFIRWDRPTALAIGADQALRILGPQAEPAIADLSQMLHEQKSVRSAMSAAATLQQMGAAGWPPLLAAFTNQQATRRVKLILTHTMGDYGTNARATVPVLMQLLQDADPRVRFEASNALQKIDPKALQRANR